MIRNTHPHLRDTGRRTRHATPFRLAARLLPAALLLSLAACDGGKKDHESAAMTPPAGEAAAAPTNRIDVPPDVRRNLGMSFVRVERRPVMSMRTVHGVVALRPDASSVLAAEVAGTVWPAVRPRAVVAQGDVIAHLVVPGLIEELEQVLLLDAEALRLRADVAVAEAAHDISRARAEAAQSAMAAIGPQADAAQDVAAKQAARLAEQQQRLAALLALLEQGAGVGQEVAALRDAMAQAEVEAATTRQQQATLAAEARALQSGLLVATAEVEETAGKVAQARRVATGAEGQAHGRRHALIARYRVTEPQLVAWLRHLQPGAMTGATPGETPRATNPRPEWPPALTLLAPSAGMVDDLLPAGSRVEAGATLAKVIDTSRLEVRLRLTTADLRRVGATIAQRASAGSSNSGGALPETPVRLRSGSASVRSGDLGTSSPVVDATLRLLPHGVTHGDAPGGMGAGGVEAVVELAHGQDVGAAAAWLLAGATVLVEIPDAGVERPRLAIPVRAIIRDGLEVVAFVRDPDNPDKVIRQPLATGASDGDWVVVEAGVGPDDEVVLDGIYELKLAGSGRAPAGGHFHADGTFHAEDH